ncbi:hypothetical protein ACEZCY_14125 [Streptacidiphilus sp. N1-12]|uniref:Uncharacterized protein n=2 Tax=Streptacidiphilus alkalitolerans TaxID=3342712 RepID=A0ABV6V9J0_9ACTN
MATDSRFTRTYDSAPEAIMHVGSTLQDFVTASELDALIGGTLAPAVIAERYYEDMAIGEPDGARIATDDAQTRSDLLDFVRYEISIAIEQRREDAAEAALAELRERDARTGQLVAQALHSGASKRAVAEALDISRPTLDKMIADQADRALFDAALELLTKYGRPHADSLQLMELLAIRSVLKQARGILAAMAQLESWDAWGPEQVEVLRRAQARAQELTAR